MAHDESWSEEALAGWTPATYKGYHPTIRIEHGGRSALIDEELALAILLLWRAGVTTLACCQDTGEATFDDSPFRHPEQRRAQEHAVGTAHIWFGALADIMRFYDMLANAGSRNDRFYARMTQAIAPGSWRVELDMRDTFSGPPRTLGWRGPSKFTTFGGTAHFPRTDIPEITARLQRHARGELGPHDLPNQEYVILSPEESAWRKDRGQ